MKILVDEMPTCTDECPFVNQIDGHSEARCRLADGTAACRDTFCSLDPENLTCDHLRKFEGAAYSSVPGCSQNVRQKFPIELN